MRSISTWTGDVVASLLAPAAGGEPSDPPLRLVVVATALGMIVGALLAPAPLERGIAIGGVIDTAPPTSIVEPE
jgi:hypothetical protein